MILQPSYSHHDIGLKPKPSCQGNPVVGCQKQLKLGQPNSIGLSIPKLKWTNGTWWVTRGVCCWTCFSIFVVWNWGGWKWWFLWALGVVPSFFGHWKAFSLTAGKNNKKSGWFDATWGNKIYYLPLFWLDNEDPKSYWNAIIYCIKEIWGSPIPASLYKNQPIRSSSSWLFIPGSWTQIRQTPQPPKAHISKDGAFRCTCRSCK